MPSTVVPTQNDIIVVVMGPIGAGKSTFIQYVAEEKQDATIDYNLRSYSAEVRLIRGKDSIGGRSVVFVDTPGFDDTYKSDIEILSLIASWLVKAYKTNLKIECILYLHRISDGRMAGSPLKNLELFASLCGNIAMPKVTIVTTMWGRVSQDIGSKRENKLKETFWKEMIEKGCKVERFKDSYDSALGIITSSLENGQTQILISHEMVDKRKTLNQTEAGITLSKQLKKLLKDQKEADNRLKSLAKSPNNRHHMIEQERAEVEQQIQQTTEQLQRLSTPGFATNLLKHFFPSKETAKYRNSTTKLAPGPAGTVVRPALTKPVVISKRENVAVNAGAAGLEKLVSKQVQKISSPIEKAQIMDKSRTNIKEAAATLTSLDESSPPRSSPESAQDSGEMAPHVSSESIHMVVEDHTALLGQVLQHARRWIDWEYTLDPRAPSMTPIWEAYGTMSDSEVCRGRGSTKKLAKDDAARWLVTELQTKIEPPCTTSDLAKELIVFHTKRMVLVEFNGEKSNSISPDDSLTSSNQLVEEPGGFPELEMLMQKKLPLDLTGEVFVTDYREPKHGGFAVVYKGVWKGKEVAVKKLKCKRNLKKSAPREASMQRRLNRETNVWAALSHPNISEFLGFADDFGDFPAMISIWYSLGAANDFLDDNEDMAIEVRIRLVQNIADGIEYLHGLKIIHGDLKPANVLIDDNHVARLCDFGLVRLDDWQGPAGMTTTSPYMGTERYKAPELFITLDNTHPVATSEGDIWALGCIALEFIDKRCPYERYNYSVTLAKAIADGEPPASRPKSSDSDSLSQNLWYILEACWAWYPENRFNASEVVKQLNQLQSAPS